MKFLDVQTASMAFNPEHRRQSLRRFLDNHEELNTNLWERSAGLGEGTLRKYLSGDTKSLTLETYSKLQEAAAKILKRDVELHELQGGDGYPVAIQYRNGSGATSKLERTNMVRDVSVTSLVVWKLAHGAEGRLGAFVLSSESVGEIPRPDHLEKAKRAFSCKLLDNANGPGYRAGHVVVVDPDAGAVIGDLCIFTDESKVESGAPSVAAVLRRITASHWVITQNEVEGEQQLSRETYPQAWPVVVHYPHGP